MKDTKTTETNTKNVGYGDNNNDSVNDKKDNNDNNNNDKINKKNNENFETNETNVESNEKNEGINSDDSGDENKQKSWILDFEIRDYARYSWFNVNADNESETIGTLPKSDVNNHGLGVARAGTEINRESDSSSVKQVHNRGVRYFFTATADETGEDDDSLIDSKLRGGDLVRGTVIGGQIIRGNVESAEVKTFKYGERNIVDAEVQNVTIVGCTLIGAKVRNIVERRDCIDIMSSYSLLYKLTQG